MRQRTAMERWRTEDRRELRVYRKSLELAFGLHRLGVPGIRDAWNETVEGTCAAGLFHIARGSALYPDPDCLEHWRTAQMTLQEIYLMLDLAVEEKRIDAEEKRELSELIAGISRMLAGLMDKFKGAPE